jgi:hypothetical protein
MHKVFLDLRKMCTTRKADDYTKEMNDQLEGESRRHVLYNRNAMTQT